ncbi:MAG: adenine phosphoribosyltransferase [Atopobiaceae bacterium]|nr:adenine phosphoribosyltransferase [Atopobiaceae bacterium]
MSSIDIENFIVDIPDYPQPGVVFKDITPLLANPVGLAATIDEFCHHVLDKGITKVVGAEARGFIFGSAVAYRLGAGFVPLRKPGKLPREVYTQQYALEYGTDELQMHKDALNENDRVLIIDDLIATGGTTLASGRLVEQAGAEIVGFAYVLELAFLNPREIVGREFDQEIFTLIKID